MACVLQFEYITRKKASTTTRGPPTNRATARVLHGAPRRAADCYGRHRLGGYRSWDVLVVGAALKPDAGSKQRPGYVDKSYERSRDLVGARVVWEATKGEKNWIHDGLVALLRRRGWSTLLGAVGPRAAAAPVALLLGNDESRSRLRTRIEFARLAAV